MYAISLLFYNDPWNATASKICSDRPAQPHASAWIRNNILQTGKYSFQLEGTIKFFEAITVWLVIHSERHSVHSLDNWSSTGQWRMAFRMLILALAPLLAFYPYDRFCHIRLKQYAGFPQLKPSLPWGHLKALHEFIARGKTDRHIGEFLSIPRCKWTCTDIYRHCVPRDQKTSRQCAPIHFGPSARPIRAVRGREPRSGRTDLEKHQELSV